MPELKQLELNAKQNAELWKTYEETEEFKAVYQKKTAIQRSAAIEEERKRVESFDDGDEQCTVEPPQI